MKNNQIILEKLKSLNTRTIALIGGEPFCHPEFHSILESCIDTETFNEICIVTNGSLIDDNMMHLYSDKRVVMQVSIDGISENTNFKTRGRNNFKIVYNNVKKLIQNNVNVIVMKVITRDNIDESKEFYSFYKKQNIDAGFFMVKQVEDRYKPTIQQLRNLLDFIYDFENNDLIKTFKVVNFSENMMFHSLGFPIMHCGAGINALSIMPNGDVYPCVKKEKYGNPITNILYDNSVDTIKSNRKIIINNDFVDNKKICSHCDIAYYCGGGCRAEEGENNQICEYNCQYFHFAKDYFIEKIFNKYLKKINKINK